MRSAFLMVLMPALFICLFLAQAAEDPVSDAIADRAKAVMTNREMDLAESSDALASYADSLRHIDVALAAQCLERSGIAAFRTNQLDTALARWQRGVQWARKADLVESESSLLNALAIGHTARGDVEAALPVYDRAIELRTTLADTAGLARTWGNLAQAYTNMGRVTEALEAIAEQEKWLQWANSPTGQVASGLRKAQILSAMGRLDEALLQIKSTDQLAQESDDAQALGLVELKYGEILLDLGRPAEALPHLEQSLTTLQANGDQHYSAFAGQSVLACLLQLGQAEEVLLRAGPMVEEVEAAGQIPLLTVLKRLQGHALFDLERNNEAEVVLSEALRLFEQRWDDLNEEENQAAIFAASGETYASLARCQLATGRPQEAFLTVERGRAPSFRQQTGASFVTLEELQAQLELINGALILFNDPQYDPLVAFVLDADGLEVVELGATGPLAADAQAALRLLAAGEDLPTCRPALARLEQALLDPILAASPTAVDRFVVIPPSFLAGFPLGLLRDQDGQAWENSQGVSYLPNASSLLALSDRQVPDKGWLAMADPVIPGPRSHHLPVSAARSQAGVPLPQARAEIAQISRQETVQLVGREATGEKLRTAMQGPLAVLHLATHAIVDPLDGGNSALVLAGNEEMDAVSAKEISGWDFQGDLVVLSGCSTFGSHRILGEGWFGLPRAFLAAGARSVVSTLWDVDDHGASIFMAAFYEALSQGAPRDQALNQARKVCQKKGMPPRDWAAFVLTGISGEEVSLLADQNAKPWIWVLAILAVAGTLFLVYRAR